MAEGWSGAAVLLGVGTAVLNIANIDRPRPLSAPEAAAELQASEAYVRRLLLTGRPVPHAVNDARRRRLNLNRRAHRPGNSARGRTECTAA